ncbi:MAG: hypothetical protein Q9219_006724 [cf. Caloplaca sp. 3 TL-2023]
MSIVPDLPQAAAVDDILEWNTSEIKEYKIHIPNPTHPKAQVSICAGQPQTCATLDGTKADFHGNSRPGARYLYYLYVQSILRQDWLVRSGHSSNITSELFRPCWDIVGPFMRDSLLASIAKELSEEHVPLVQITGKHSSEGSNSGVGNPEEQEDPSALFEMCRQIADTAAQQGNLGFHDDYSDDGDSDEDGDEEEEEETENGSVLDLLWDGRKWPLMR